VQIGRFAREHLYTGFNREGFGRALAGLWLTSEGFDRALACLWQENSGTQCPRTEKTLAWLWQGFDMPEKAKAAT
jgi:hypothetical protein